MEYKVSFRNVTWSTILQTEKSREPFGEVPSYIFGRGNQNYEDFL